MLTAGLLAVAWAEADAGDALLGLAEAAGLAPVRRVLPRLSGGASADPAARERWLSTCADVLGLQLQPAECHYGELRELLSGCAPALICLKGDAQRHYLAVRGRRRAWLRVLTPELACATVAVSEVLAALTAELTRVPAQRIERWLVRLRLSPRRQERVHRHLLGQMLEQQRIAGVWLLQADPGRPLAAQPRTRRALRAGLGSLCSSLLQLAVSVGGWVLLGRSALSGSAEWGWLVAWALATLSAAWLQLASVRGGWTLLHALALWLKQRLLCGALRLPLDEIRTRGSGRLLAMVAESEALENAGLNGGFGLILAAMQLVSAALVLPLGAGGLWHLGLLLLWSGWVGRLWWLSWRGRHRWTEQRFDLARGFVENLVGNRTRIAQQPSVRWHLREDEQLQQYLAASRTHDAVQAQLSALPARGWLLLALLGLAPAILSQPGETALAIALGGILQAYMAFAALASHSLAVGAALVAWQRVRELYQAAAQLPPPGRPEVAVQAHAAHAPSRASTGGLPPANEALALDARGLLYRYRAGAEPALRGCDLSVQAGERVLIEGPSGGGKSTLASLLLGLRAAEAGHVLLGGLDRHTLGAASWLQRIASAPQFHDNHVLSGTLAFNLLMGRHWPPAPEDLADAEQLCAELGLGPLLRRMPSGIHQVVGETGWQLSHGERSRLFLARAVLQGAGVLVLDETFGALDPLTLQQCMRCVRQRAGSLVVIAHP